MGDGDSVEELCPAASKFANHTAASTDSIVRWSYEVASSADVPREKKSVYKDGNPSTGVDATVGDDSNAEVDTVVNGDLSAPAETAQVYNEQSITPSRVESRAND